MRELSPDETASIFRERDEIAARERERRSGLPPDLEALASRIFGEEKAPDFGDSLERLTVALVALRAALVPDPSSEGRLGREVFLRILERIASSTSAALIIPRGEISTEAPELLLNPTFWLGIEGLREEALSGDKAASDRLDRVLSVLRVPKRRTEAGRAKAAAERVALARELRDDPEFMAGSRAALAVRIARDGKRGPVPLRAAELLLDSPAALDRVARIEAEAEASPDPARRRALLETSGDLRAGLTERAFTLEGRRLRTAKRKRAKTRGPK